MRKNRINILISFLVLIGTARASELTKSPVSFPEPPSSTSPNKVPEGLTNNAILSIDTTNVQPLAKFAVNDQPSIMVIPEVTTPVEMSASDLNRITCPVEIKDAITSSEKGLIIKITGRDAFIKFKVLKSPEGKVKYTTTPTEIFVVCGDNTYSLVAFPGKGPSRTIRLSSGESKKIKDNQSIYSGLPFEKKVIRAIKDIFTEQIPDSYTITKVNRIAGNYSEFNLIHRRSIAIEGEGLNVNEFEASLKPGKSQFKLNEKFFINKAFSGNPVAVSLEKQILYPGESTRIFIVGQRQEKQFSVNFDRLNQSPEEETSVIEAEKPSTSKILNLAKKNEGVTHVK